MRSPDSSSFDLSFPKLALRFGKRAGIGETLFPLSDGAGSSRDRMWGGPGRCGSWLQGASDGRKRALTKQSFRTHGAFPKRLANFGNERLNSTENLNPNAPNSRNR